MINKTKMHASLSAILVSIGLLCLSSAPSLAQTTNGGGTNGGGTNNGGTNNGGTNNGGTNNGGTNNGGTNNSTRGNTNFGAPSAAGNFQTQAADIQTRLAAAEAAARASKPPAGDGVRRFLRAASDCKCGGSPEQAELEKVKAEAAAFLTEAKSQKPFNPAW
jgi:hypothetical protein